MHRTQIDPLITPPQSTQAFKMHGSGVITDLVQLQLCFYDESSIKKKKKKQAADG